MIIIFVLCLVNSVNNTAHALDNPIQEKMLRIAEVLGSLHFLRNLCGETSQTWREQMDELITKENPAEAERLRLISNFNRGYRNYSDNYTRCTPSALAAIERYLKEGAQLSKELISRYGN
ncbi:TIGR02301 family protein [Brucellaceae bacterium C25G]